ncbi:MAG: FtsX-like permease family protein [Gammaproteobacteria bacterium]|nr:FtsX-like permease family protein [Gammaproteobacteria bacterium]
MRYFPLVWSTLWRRKARTVFTLASIAVAFLLYGALSMIGYALTHPGGANGADKLITINKYSITLPLPIAATQQIAAVPGVEVVTWLTWFGGYYQDPKNFVFALPVDPDSYLALHAGEYTIDPQQLQTFKNSRTGTLVSADLAKKFGWKVGDKIPIHSTIWTQGNGSLDWVFDMVGTFTAPDPTMRGQISTMLLFHYKYFDEARSFGKGTIGWFEEKVADPNQSAAIADAIDARFANSTNETKTQPAKDFAMSFLKQYGDIGFILRAILGAVFFALLFLTGNTMMQSVRERIPELAVLKTLGFSDTGVLALVLAESALLCVLAAVVGLLLSLGFLPLFRSALQGVELTPVAVLPGLAIAVVLALIVGTPPALRALRLDVVDALSGH